LRPPRLNGIVEIISNLDILPFINGIGKRATMSLAPDEFKSKRTELQDWKRSFLAEGQALEKDPVLLFPLKVENIRFAPPTGVNDGPER
jgi:hypothetical protein